MDDMREDTYFSELPVKLTDVELRDRGSRLADIALAIAATQEEAKEKAREYRNSIDKMNEQGAVLARAIHSKQEDRPVECGERVNRADLTVETMRLDTGEIVRSRGMTTEEREEATQAALPFFRVEAQKAEEAPVAETEQDAEVATMPEEASELEEQVHVVDAVPRATKGQETSEEGETFERYVPPPAAKRRRPKVVDLARDGLPGTATNPNPLPPTLEKADEE